MQLAKFIPLNPVEHENELRTIILKHQGSTSGNPTQWVVDAVAEAFQRGFGLGFNAGLSAANTPPPPPRYGVQIPNGMVPHLERQTTKALPFVDREFFEG